MIPLSNMGATWNASTESVNTAIGMNVTDIQSAANSRLLSLKVDDVDRFYITKDGTVNYSNAVSDTITSNNITSDYFYVDSGGYMTLAGDTFVLNADPNDYIGYYRPSNLWNFFVGGVAEFQIYSGGVTVANNITFNGAIDEKVATLVGTALNPSNGTIQTVTLSTNPTLTATTFNEGESMTLMIDDGSANTITWPTMTWVNNGGSAPTLATTGYTVVALWKVSTTLYGALVGDGS